MITTKRHWKSDSDHRTSSKTWQPKARTLLTVLPLQQSSAATGRFLTGSELKTAILVAQEKPLPTLCRTQRNFTGARSKIIPFSCTRKELANCQTSITIQCTESRSGLLPALKSCQWMRKKCLLPLVQEGPLEQSSAKASKVVCRVINREFTPILEQTSRIK